MEFLKAIGAFILRFIWWIVKFVLRIVLGLLVLYAVFYLLITKVDWQKHVDPQDIPDRVYDLAHKLDFHNWGELALPDINLPSFGGTPDAIFAINEDNSSPIGAVLTYEDGGGLVIYMRSLGSARIMDRIIAEDAEGHQTTLTFSDNGLPRTLEFAGYTVEYSDFRTSSFDLKITSPDGTVEVKEDVPLDFSSKSAMYEMFAPEVAHALGADTAVNFLGKYIAKAATAVGLTGANAAGNAIIDFNDVKDHSYWKEAVGLAVNTGVCAGGVLTILVPNPLSVGAIALGCGGAILDAAPVVVDLDPCNTKDVYSKGCFGEILDQIQGIDNSSPIARFYLSGQVKRDPYGAVENAKLVFTHKSGEKITVVAEKGNGLFGHSLDAGGAALRTGAYTVVVTAPGFETLNLTGAVSDDRIKFVDTESGKTVYDQKRGWNMKSWDVMMLTTEDAAEKETEEKEVTPASSGDSSDYTGKYKGDIYMDGSINNAANFPFMNEFFGFLEIEIGKNNEIDCYWSFEGALNYSSDVGSIAGDTNVESTKCDGMLIPGDAVKINISGKQKGTEPPANFNDPDHATLGKGKVGGSYKDVDFAIQAYLTGEEITSTLQSFRGVFTNSTGTGIGIILKKQ